MAASNIHYAIADRDRGLACGGIGDLKRATILDATGTTIDTKYYRYYKAGEANGYADGLKYAFDSRSYSRLLAAFQSDSAIDAASDDQVTAYAAHYFEYDSIHRCTRHDIQSFGGGSTGIGSNTYTYATNPSYPTNLTDPVQIANTWYTKTVETLPDSNQNVVYTNIQGAVMLKVFCDLHDAAAPSLVNKQWGTFYRLDGNGRILWEAKPSAVDLSAGLAALEQYTPGVDDRPGDLLHSRGGNYLYLKDSSGRIDVTDYYTATTATNGTAGGVQGYVQDERVRHGELGTPALGTDILLSSETYFARTSIDTNTTIYPVASTTLYANSDGTGMRTTTYSYTWYTTGSGLQPQCVTTSLPVVTTAQNGSGSAAVAYSYYDAHGLLAWTKDAGGFVDATEYDIVSGAVMKSIQDVDYTKLSSGSNGEQAAFNLTGWSQRTGGAHLVSLYVPDDLGRTVMATDPAGRITYTVYKDAAHEVRVYSGWDPASHTALLPIAVAREDRNGNYDETLTMSATPTLDANNNPTGMEAIGTIQSLSRDYYNNAGQLDHTDDYFTLAGAPYSTAITLGTLGTNFYRTSYSYDVNGNQYRTVDATGTIAENDYDSRGRVASTWMGTSDATLVQVTADEYDGGYVGDGNLTRVTQFPGGAVANPVTQCVYDWRDRLTDTKPADGLVTKYSYDNLGEVTELQTYVDSNGNWTVDSGELRSQSVSYYDDLGQIYRVSDYQIDPSTHLAGDRLTTNLWYDNRGLIVKTADAKGLFAKDRYDGAGRLIASYISYDAGESSYADALNVTGDTVIEQNRYWYDGDDNVVVQTDYKRLESDSSSTGELSAANSHASSTVNWYDKAGRLVTTANIGHESSTDTNHYVFSSSGTLIDSAPADGIPDIAEGSPLLPNSSDDYIVGKTEYDSAGNAWRQTDNGGHKTVTLYDMLGRTTATIENYVDGNVTETEYSDTDRTTQYFYDSHGRLSIQRALNPQGAGNGVQQQDTRYLYNDPHNGSLQTSVIYPDSSDTTSSGTDQVKYTYDNLGRKLTSTDQRGVVHSYSYDPVGRLSADTVTSLGRSNQNVDGSVRRIEYGYDDQGRLQTTTSYNAVSGGNVVNQVQYTYDGWGNITKEQQAHTGAVTTSTPATQYVCDDGAVGGEAKYIRQTQTIYPSGRVIYFNYESTPTGRLASLSENSSGTQSLVTYTYLGMDTIVKESHQQVSGGLNLSYGSSGTYSGFDRFGRIVQQLWKSDAATTIDGYTYTYDRTGNRTSKGNSLNSSYTESYAYDGLNRLTSINRNNAALQSWGLDAQGNWASNTTSSGTQTRTSDAADETTDVSGPWADPTYDAAGSMTTIPRAGNESVGLIATYDAWNHLVTLTNPATNHETIYSYDGLGRRISATDTTRQGVGPILVVNDGSVQRSAVVSLTIVFESAVTLQTGAISLVQRGGSAVPFTLSNPSGDGRTWVFTFTGNNLENGSLPDGIYDVSVDGSKVLVNGSALGGTYVFAFHRFLGDLNGNRVVQPTDVATINQAEADPSHFWWYCDLNADGVVNDADTDVIRARLNRSVGSYTSGTTFIGPSTTAATSGFDKIYAGVCTRDFYYNAQGQVVEEQATDADTLLRYTTSSYVWDQRYIDAPVMVYRDTNADGVVDQKLYVMQDANFDVTATVNGATGAVVNRFVYTPYGQRTVLTSAWGAGTTDFQLGHQGLYLDTESGMYYNDARYYHPTLGRFIQRDPAGYIDGANVYQYERSNPVNSVDPWGLATYDPYLDYLWNGRCLGPSNVTTFAPSTQPFNSDPFRGFMEWLGHQMYSDPSGAYVPAPDNTATAGSILYEFYNDTGPAVRNFGPDSFMTSVVKESGMLDEFRNLALRSGHDVKFATTESLGNGWLVGPSYVWDGTRGLVNRFSGGAIGNMGFVGSFQGQVTVCKEQDGTVRLLWRVWNVTSSQSGHCLTHRDKTQIWQWEERSAAPLPLYGAPMYPPGDHGP